MSWTDERVESLKKLWAEGLSASQIAAQLGGVSRNAVIGKVHRLKLSSRGRTNAAPARPKKPAPAATPAPSAAAPAARHKPRPAAAAAPSRPMMTTVGATALKVQFEEEEAVFHHYRAVPSNVVPIARNLKLVELSERTCKWPNGDPLSDDFSFCGADSGESGPYCGFHSKLAYQPAAERRRVR